MASLGSQRFRPTTPHFFQIILDDTSRHKLKIAKKFVMKYGKDLSNLVTLKLPSGSEWEVELTRCEGKVWFDKGWPEFSMDCSLDYGSFLVFRYEGHSLFHVCIFDTSATEIDYPITTSKIVEVNEDDDLSPLPAYHHDKKMRTSLSGKADMVSEREKTQPCDMYEKPIANEDTHCSKSDMKRLESKEKDGRVTKRYIKQTSNQLLLGNTLALRKAYDLKTGNPSFTVSLQPSDIQCSLSLPFEFAKRHLMKHPASKILLVLDGTKCSVDVTYSEQIAQFQRGWLTFVKDNNLEVGDVCVFVLIEDVKPVLRVIIFRTSEVTNQFLSQGENDFVTSIDGGSSSSTERIPKKAPRGYAFKFDKPSCQISLHPSTVHYHLMSFPNAFARKYLKDLPASNVILRVSDDTWSVKFKYDHANSRARLLCGWKSFVRDNKLKVGNVCVFTLIDSVELLFEVAIYPTEEFANCPSSTDHGRGETEHESNMNSENGASSSLEICMTKESNVMGKVTHRPSSSLRETTVNLDDANKFSSKNPFFKATIGLRELKKSTVNLPANFVKSVMTLIKPGKHKILLQFKDSLWPVNLISYNRYSASIHGGWTAFAKEHGIKEGDVCLFELIKMNEFVLKVHIFRR